MIDIVDLHRKSTSRVISIASIASIIFIIITYSLYILLINPYGELSSVVTGSDARAFISAADMVVAGDGGRLYDLQAQFVTQQHRFPGIRNLEDLLVFAYPPFVAVALSPLALFESETAYLILFLSNLVLLLLCISLIYALTKNQSQLFQLAALLGLLSFSPIMATLSNAQFSLLLLTSLLASWYSFEHDKPFLAGLFLSILAVKPYLLLLPLTALFSMRQLKPLLGIASGGGFLVVVGLMMGGINGWVSWYELGQQMLQLDGDYYGIHLQAMYTLRSMLSVLLESNDSMVVRYLWLLAVIAGVIGVIVVFLSIRRWDSGKTPLVWGSLTAAIILFSPHAYLHDMLLLYLPCLALARVATESANATKVKVAIICFVTWMVFHFYPSGAVLNPPSLSVVPITVLIIVASAILYRQPTKNCTTDEIGCRT